MIQIDIAPNNRIYTPLDYKEAKDLICRAEEHNLTFIEIDSIEINSAGNENQKMLINVNHIISLM